LGVRRKLVIALLVGAGFLWVLVSRLPARWVLSWASSSVSCSEVEGSIWSGSCTGMSVQGQPIGDVLWTLRPLALLTGKLAAHLVLTNGPTTVRGDVEARGSSSITLLNVVADLPLAAVPVVPPTLRGSAHLDIARVMFVNTAVTQLQGRIELHDLEDRSRGTTPLGSYSLTFPPGERIAPAKLRDLGGPLAVEGTLQLTLQPGFHGQYVLQGLVAARPTAPAELQQSLLVLGSPDARGMRTFSEERSF
jgi:general secretion pathway protein N